MPIPGLARSAQLGRVVVVLRPWNAESDITDQRLTGVIQFGRAVDASHSSGFEGVICRCPPDWW